MPKLAPLLTPFTLPPFALPNRLVLAPMARGRAGAGGVPTQLSADYFEQRAGAGLLITGGTAVSAQAIGTLGVPGIYTAAQVAGWQAVTGAVHERGGRIFMQLWHVGRMSHPLFQAGGALPVAPSAIAPAGQLLTPEGMRDFVIPRALETAELPGLIAQFQRGAELAKEADFDGVELHGADGYLFDQFLQDGANRRSDQYGGSFENRARLLLETAAAVVAVWGPGRVGVRLSPSSTANGMADANPIALFEYVVGRLNELPLAYLHLMEPTRPVPAGSPRLPAGSAHFRPLYRGPLMTNGGYDFAKGNQAIADRQADLVSFGLLFLVNPDLPARFATGAPLNTPDSRTFFGSTAAGYTDYPVLLGGVQVLEQPASPAEK